jgi:carbohydrate-selective porin OprB
MPMDPWPPSRWRGKPISALLLATVLFCLVAPFPDVAYAHHPALNPTVHTETSVEAVPGADQPSITSIIPALGDFKKRLLDRGVNFQLSYIQDTFGNPIGGVKQGAAYGSVLYMAVDADLAKLAGLPGATFRVNAYQIQGRSLSTYNIFNYSTISGLAARLFELWVEQKLFADMASIRIGQLTAEPCRFAAMSSRLNLPIRRRSVPAGSFSPISNTSFARAAA